MMDVAGIDAAWLTSAAGMCADLDTSRLVNDKAKKAERDYPGRFIGAAHAHPLGGAAAFKELARCRHELGFQGVTITSEFDGKWIDDPAIEPFWDEVGKLGMFVFVHPALKLNHAAAIRRLRHRARRRPRILADHGDDPAGQFRRVRPPSRTHRAHGASLRRHRRRCWPASAVFRTRIFGAPPATRATASTAKHDFDYYIRNNLVFDTAGFAGGIGAVKAGLVRNPRVAHRVRHRLSAGNPQARNRARLRARHPRARRRWRADLSGNVGLLLKEPSRAHA